MFVEDRNAETDVMVLSLTCSCIGLAKKLREASLRVGEGGSGGALSNVPLLGLQ